MALAFFGILFGLFMGAYHHVRWHLGKSWGNIFLGLSLLSLAIVAYLLFTKLWHIREESLASLEAAAPAIVQPSVQTPLDPDFAKRVRTVRLQLLRVPACATFDSDLALLEKADYGQDTLEAIWKKAKEAQCLEPKTQTPPAPLPPAVPQP